MPFRRIPWIVLFEAVIAARRRWRDLHPDDRSRLTALVRKSRGRPHQLTRAERAEFRQIASRLVPSASSAFSTCRCVAMPAWSVPSVQRVRRPSIRW